MRTLIYKRTHTGDPDPATGVFGNHDCMKSVRGHPFDAVIGIGGVSQRPTREGIARKLTWIGIGPQVCDWYGDNPILRFRHFWYRGECGPLLDQDYPALARRMYAVNRRHIRHWPGKFPDIDEDVEKILCLGKTASSSINRLAEPNFRVTSVVCRPKSRDRRVRVRDADRS